MRLRIDACAPSAARAEGRDTEKLIRSLVRGVLRAAGGRRAGERATNYLKLLAPRARRELWATGRKRPARPSRVGIAAPWRSPPNTPAPAGAPSYRVLSRLAGRGRAAGAAGAQDSNSGHQ